MISRCSHLFVTLGQPEIDFISELRGNELRIATGADHAGMQMKNMIVDYLKGLGHQVIDLGAHSYNPHDDYPDFARLVANAIASSQADRGILICGSGVGACIAANKVRGVRAAICHDTYSARQGVEHDDMNVLCLGSRIIGDEVAKTLVGAFVSAKFSNEERHIRRLRKTMALENEHTT